jgi:hypothetical protein
MSQAVAAQPDVGRSSGRGPIFLNCRHRQVQFTKAAHNFPPEFVLPYPGDDHAIRAERMRMISKVSGRAAHLPASPEHVPEHLANPNDIEFRFHSSIGAKPNPGSF